MSANTALLSWIEQQTGKPQSADPFEDEEGADPWREVHDLVKHVADAMALEVPAALSKHALPPDRSETPMPDVQQATQVDQQMNAEPEESVEGANPPDARAQVRARSDELPAKSLSGDFSHAQWSLTPAPRGEDDSEQPSILLCAVLGLFPTAHQGLLRDTRAMLTDEIAPTGPIQNFLTSGIDFDAPPAPVAPTPAVTSNPAQGSARLAAAADPCQARAVALARQASGLVIHGPPGTGKSQTITNIIADHLARGERVLLVCDKRTALDVVADRLEHMGLGNLCGIVHDPQRDQRELYRAIHQQLDELTQARLYPHAAGALEKVDDELLKIHDELTHFHSALMDHKAPGAASFHELMGRWMSLQGQSTARLDAAHVAEISVEQFELHQAALVELFERAMNSDFAHNLWVKAAGASLADFLARPMSQSRTAMDRITVAADLVDAAADSRIVGFADQPSVMQQAHARQDLAEPLAQLLPKVRETKLTHLASQEMAGLTQFRQKLEGLQAQVDVFHSGPIDANLLQFVPSSMPATQIQRNLLTLREYIASTESWTGMFALGLKAEAATLLKQYALSRTRENALRLQTFLSALSARRAIAALMSDATLPPDEKIELFLQTADDWSLLLQRLGTEPALTGIALLLRRLLAIKPQADLKKCGTNRSDAGFYRRLKALDGQGPGVDQVG